MSDTLYEIMKRCMLGTRPLREVIEQTEPLTAPRGTEYDRPEHFGSRLLTGDEYAEQVERLNTITEVSSDGYAGQVRIDGVQMAVVWEGEADSPPWVEDPDAQPPTLEGALLSELFVAGRLSTMPPFDRYHPAWCLPFARAALDALNDWEPDL